MVLSYICSMWTIKNFHFFSQKNRIVNRELEKQTIPTLELHGVGLGADSLIDTYEDICGCATVVPINISELILFTDSSVCLSWIQWFANKYEKVNKLSIFVQNRLNKIVKFWEIFTIRFEFCSGKENPAD